MSWKDQARLRHAAEKRGRRGTRRAGAMLLRGMVTHPVIIGFDPGGEDMTGCAVFDPATGTVVGGPAFLEDEDTAL